jgi:integrase/recombinase XerD
MLPIQRSTPAEGSVGGVGRIHDHLEAAGHGDDEQGPLFRPIRNNRTGRIDKALVGEGP